MASTSSYPSLSSSPSNLNETGAHLITRGKALTIIYYCTAPFGLLGNMFVLIVLGSSSTLRKNRTNKLIMNQSVIDFLGAVFFILTTAIDHDIQGNYAYCVLWKTKQPFWMLMYSSSLALLFITIERYLAIVHALWYKMKVSDRRMRFSIAIVWSLGIIYTVPMAVNSCRINTDGYCSCTWEYSSPIVKRAFGVFIFSVNFLIPMMVHVVCYIRIFYTLWVHQRNIVHGKDVYKEENAADYLIRHQKMMKNVVVTLITVTVCFVACWFCNQFSILLSHFDYHIDFAGDFYHFTVLAVFCNSCINPIVYMVKYIAFKEQAKKIICWHKKENAAEENSEQTDSESTYIISDS